MSAKQDIRKSIDEATRKAARGEYSASISAFEDLLEQNEDLPSVRLEMAHFLVKTGQLELGLEVLQETVKRFSKNSLAYRFLGAALSRCGKGAYAKRIFRKAIELDNTQPLWVYHEAELPRFDIISNDEYKIAFSPIPKCASSSIKNMFYSLDTGQNTINPHPFFNNPFFKTNSKAVQDYEDYCTIAIIREPVIRLLSYYYKNIVSAHSLENDFDKNLPIFGLEPKPNVNTFVDRLEEYIYAFNDVRHHTLHQGAYLGDDIQAYNLVCPLEDAWKAIGEINKIAGRDIEPPRLMKSSKNVKNMFNELSLSSLEKLIEFYEGDYKLLKNYFTPKQLLSSYREWLLTELKE